MRLFLNTNVFSLSHSSAELAVYDESFSDMEDSFQYRCALENRCQVLITINDSDFKSSDSSEIEILTPLAFIEKYM